MRSAVHAIDKRSLRKDEAWQFISYMMSDEVFQRHLLIGMAEPTIVNSAIGDHLNADSWLASLDRTLELQNQTDDTLMYSIEILCIS